MGGVAGEAEEAALRVTFDPRLKLEFHGSKVTSDAGLLAFRDLDDALGLTELAGEVLTDTRTGQKSRHTLTAQIRQSVFGRLAGYEDVNDADRLGRDPAMRWVVGGRAVTQNAASTSQMGRFETEVLTQEANLAALTNLSGQWIKEGKNAVRWTRLSCRSIKANAVRLQLHALAYNLANFFRTLALPDEIERWSLTTLREKVVKIGAKVITHARYTVFQMAEVAVPRDLFRRILDLIHDLRPKRIVRC